MSRPRVPKRTDRALLSVRTSVALRLDAHRFAYFIRGMHDNLFIFLEATKYFGLERRTLTDLHLAAIRFVFLNHENAPAVTRAEERA